MTIDEAITILIKAYKSSNNYQQFFLNQKKLKTSGITKTAKINKIFQLFYSSRDRAQALPKMTSVVPQKKNDISSSLEEV